ncbi:phospholipase D-like domain-containing protein [Alkalihalobacillus sp. AL-G]|uniref:phospholipase D-like domain-containing protein n=1 Tax=Alkalihalobacillus sp. AL-G TaxID=2926399 RepID=UPI002729604B|nr:phospholipase D-like domain-containing protein [Alkalihalobacillus sp. AL-G]WLD94271.1 phospholipase D-like domain-containing protein [Alkalihalobacillus sp. AL-G]
MKRLLQILIVTTLSMTLVNPMQSLKEVDAAANGEVVINEAAWMGTNVSYNNEWIELYNPTGNPISLEGWTLSTADGTPSISLSGSIPAKDYYLLERTADSTVSAVTANQIYSGSLSNSGELLVLKDESGIEIDSVDQWYAGDNETKATMERIDPAISGTTATNWKTATDSYEEGLGTPASGAMSSATGCDTSTEQINQVSETLGAINVYFNKCALPIYADTGNKANYNVNLEDRLIKRLNEATTSIDFATYEINLTRVADALINKAAEGVDVRVIADSKDATDPHYIDRFKTMRLYVEKMVRGADLVLGTNDDIEVFSDSPMFAVEDKTLRSDYGLPTSAKDFPYVTTTVGSTETSGYLFVDAEQKSDGTYYSPGNQMHNKFALIDDRWVFTGSWNFTVTGLYGSEENMQNGILDGNQNHVVELHSPELAGIYETEFHEMWGDTDLTPDPVNANLGSRKIDNTQHVVTVGGKTIEIFFSPGDDAVGRMTEIVKNDADLNTYFTIFAWSDQDLVNELKYKWEGSYQDLMGTRTGFDVRGVYDSSFWNQWWSASIEMTGRTASQSSTNNPNIRWANPAPVYEDAEVRKLHSKTMLIDTDTSSDPTVIVGSTNWSTNGNDHNDENMLIIHDTLIANQFLQEFYARYSQAGGTIPLQ